MSIRDFFKKKATTEEEKPRIKKGMGSFEEFEGSDRTRSVEQSPYAPKYDLTTKEYAIPSVLVNFGDDFERFLQEFFEKAAPDELNDNFLDAKLKCLEQSAIASIDLQRAEHLNGQINLIKNTWNDGQYDYASLIAVRKEEKDEVEKEIRKLTRILYEGTAFAEE